MRSGSKRKCGATKVFLNRIGAPALLSELFHLPLSTDGKAEAQIMAQIKASWLRAGFTPVDSRGLWTA